MLRRRTAVLAGGLVASGFGPATPGMAGAIVGANASLGHRLRGPLPEPIATSEAQVVVVGGGIAGLSAAWWLGRAGVRDVTVLEMEREVGGNAASGRNAVSAYPWGAHYVPLLTAQSVHAAMLFEELGIITGRTPQGAPIYDEFALCADARERLFDQGRWQDDLLPQIGVAATDRQQYRQFFAAMATYRGARGSDGRRAFAIPLDLSSIDARWRDLDALPMTTWMQAQGWDSPALHWYVDYCTRDDYGTHAAEVSAWAGIHYFAARDDAPTVLTWPEGNGHIVAQMKARLGATQLCNALVWRVRPQADGVAIDVFDPAQQTSRRILARAAILAVPHFVADRLLDRAADAAHSYAPWMVANVTVDRLPGGRGAPLCWDNVFRDSASLGYVVATHQSLETRREATVLTHYWPLCDAPPAEARRMALGRTLGEWQAMVLQDLLRAHPELEGHVERIDVWLWGHGMIRPTPGYIWGPARAAACVQEPPVFFAHSDMSGISIFEEANHRGVLAAEAVMASLA